VFLVRVYHIVPAAKDVTDSLVRYPLILVCLVALWLLPYLLRGGSVPGAVRPLLGFAAVSVVAAGAAAYLPLLPYRGQVPAGRELRALATLAIGVCFYLCACLLPESEARRRKPCHSRGRR
jgi:hypothetical protein